MTSLRRKPADARRTYGVLVGAIEDGVLNRRGASPHYEIWIKAAGVDYRAAVNVRSVDGSQVVAWWDEDYREATRLDLPTLAGAPGFRPLTTGPRGEGLDYLRDGLFPVQDMRPIPMDGGGETLRNLLDGAVNEAKGQRGAVAVIFGESFHDDGPDSTFPFSPERGVHDVHMMQGNGGQFADDNRVNGDGALFIRSASGKTLALFIRFKTQATETDNETGGPV